MSTWKIEYRPKSNKNIGWQSMGRVLDQPTTLLFDTRREARAYILKSGNPTHFYYKPTQCIDIPYKE